MEGKKILPIHDANMSMNQIIVTQSFYISCNEWIPSKYPEIYFVSAFLDYSAMSNKAFLLVTTHERYSVQR